MIFDRSWYNRAGVERVMGFCTEEQAKQFLQMIPGVEKAIVDGLTRRRSRLFWISASSFSEFADAVRCCFIGRGVDAFYSASFLIPVRIARCEALALFRLLGGITRACAINRMSGC
jgi:hypothetical protein